MGLEAAAMTPHLHVWFTAEDGTEYCDVCHVPRVELIHDHVGEDEDE